MPEEETFTTGTIVASNGVLYEALEDTTTAPPAEHPEAWAPVSAVAWTPLELGTKVQAGEVAPACRMEGNGILRFRGSFLVKAGKEVAPGDTCFTLPAGFRRAEALPVSYMVWLIGAGAVFLSSVTIDLATGVATNGHQNPFISGVEVSLHGLTYAH